MTIDELVKQRADIDRRLSEASAVASSAAKLAADKARRTLGVEAMRVERERITREIHDERAKALDASSPALPDGWFWESKGVAAANGYDPVYCTDGPDGLLVVFEEDDDPPIKRPVAVVEAVIAAARGTK